MTLDHIETMLKTMQQHSHSEIALTFKNKEQVPVLLVCYQNQCFQLTYLDNHTIETYDDMSSTVLAIDRAVRTDLQESSK